MGQPLRGGRFVYNGGMTLMEVTYDLQQALQPQQLRSLGAIANIYGFRRFRVNEQLQQISIEYDGSRLQEVQVRDALRGASIPVVQKA